MRPLKLAKESPLPPFCCLACGFVADLASGVVDQRARNKEIKPTPGDLSICFKCGHLAVFKADLTLRPLTGEERRAAAADFRVALTVYGIRAKNKER
jgi:hypothetical protein